MKVIKRFFFFQAEDGIRGYKVTGVQTCALPICERPGERGVQSDAHLAGIIGRRGGPARRGRPGREGAGDRSEERRVGKERRLGWWQDAKKKTRNLRNREKQMKICRTITRIERQV